MALGAGVLQLVWSAARVGDQQWVQFLRISGSSAIVAALVLPMLLPKGHPRPKMAAIVLLTPKSREHDVLNLVLEY
jgi:hypothetical protein